MKNVPRTAREYRQWWHRQKPNIPYGACWCGCQQPTKFAPRTQVSRQWFKGEPIKFIHRHGYNVKPRIDFGVNQNDGLCHCGCGSSAPIAKGTDRRFGLIKGEPVRYINGHHIQLPETYTVEDRGYKTPCHIFRNAKSDGYGYVHRKGRFIYAHRYFHEKENGPLPDGYHLHHKCEVKNCIRLSHLEPLRIVDHQRIHSRTKLNLEKARRIRYLVLVCGLQRKDVAKEYGVSSSLIEAVVNRLIWEEDA